MAVKATDLWRTPVNVTPAFWERTIRGAGGPAELASRAGYDAAYPLTALALAMLKRESSYATDFDANPAANKNPWNLKSPSYDGSYVAYPTWVDGARGWRERITSTWFEAFDERWKGGPHPDEVEKHWGLFRSDRTPKQAVAGPR